MGLKPRTANAKGFHDALCARAPFLNELLRHANEEDHYRPRIHVGDRVEVHREKATNIKDALVVEVNDGHPLLECTIDGKKQRLTVDDDDWIDVQSSPTANAIWEGHQKSTNPDGVAWADGLIKPALRKRLGEQFDKIIKNEPADFHPGSGTAVRDLVHPSLYPYVAGQSQLAEGATPPSSPADKTLDIWGRPYEKSRFQWLPTNLQVDAKGKASFEGYINNLDEDKYSTFYRDLEELFEKALPLFESVNGFARTLDPWDDREDDCEADLPEPDWQSKPPVPVKPVSLRNRKLQVITKVVEYQIDADNHFEGVWHVEGMSHENILATGVYVLQRDKHLQGGEIRFKRGYSRQEAGQLFWNINQVRSGPVDEMAGESVLPLGSLSTPQGRLFVFPNSHIHKLSDMVSADGSTARRRIIVFWLVNPETPILSTQEVPKQQGKGTRRKALANRLDLMEERRRHKQSHNLREVSLCEH